MSMGVALVLDQSQLADPRIGLAQAHAELFSQAHQPLARLRACVGWKHHRLSCSLVSRRSCGRIANPPLHQLEREESRLAIRGNPQNRFARKSPSKGQKPANSIT